jgi:hypothetical protein
VISVIGGGNQNGPLLHVQRGAIRRSIGHVARPPGKRRREQKTLPLAAMLCSARKTSSNEKWTRQSRQKTRSAFGSGSLEEVHLPEGDAIGRVVLILHDLIPNDVGADR